MTPLVQDTAAFIEAVRTLSGRSALELADQFMAANPLTQKVRGFDIINPAWMYLIPLPEIKTTVYVVVPESSLSLAYIFKAADK